MSAGFFYYARPTTYNHNTICVPNALCVTHIILYELIFFRSVFFHAAYAIMHQL